MILEYFITDIDSGRKIKYILKQNLKMSEKHIRTLKYLNAIKVNNIPVRVIDCVKTGDHITVNLNTYKESSNVLPELNLNLEIIYEDEGIIAINKPHNMLTHPVGIHQSGTAANFISGHYKKQNSINAVRPVSRLDKDTSGIVIFAKNQFVQKILISQMQSNEYHKYYIGICHGIPNKSTGIIELPISRKKDSIIQRDILQDGLNCITKYWVLEEFPDFNLSLIKYKIETGRTHQIRLHSLYAGFPILGETLYTPNNYPHAPESTFSINEHTKLINTNIINRQALHAIYSTFFHPNKKETKISIFASLPPDYCNLLQCIDLKCDLFKHFEWL